jgi:hypothetical protein
VKSERPALSKHLARRSGDWWYLASAFVLFVSLW